jgi:hypothetical protein
MKVKTQAAQKKSPGFCDLLIKHQCIPDCISWCKEILVGGDRSEVFPGTRALVLGRVSYFPAFLRVQRVLLHTLPKDQSRSPREGEGQLICEGEAFYDSTVTRRFGHRD